MKNSKLTEIQFDDATAKFVNKHLTFNADQFWWYVWASWLLYAAFMPWLIPLARLRYDISLFDHSKILVLAIGPLLLPLIYFFIDWSVERVLLLLDRRSKKLSHYRGAMKVRKQRFKGRIEERFIELLDVDPKVSRQRITNIEIPLETDFTWPNDASGELEYLYYSKIPYRLDGRPINQTRFCPFTVNTSRILFFLCGVATVACAVFFPVAWAFLAAAIYLLGVEKLVPQKDPESIPFWNNEHLA